MSNRNFDSRVIIQRLQDKNYARNFYLYNTTGQRILNNPQNSNSGALRYSTYHDGSQTMYFRGLIGGGMTVDSGGVFGIPPYPGFGISDGGSIGPIITIPAAPTISSILSGNQQLTVSFLAPASDGGSVITDYQYSTNINAFSSIGATVAPFIITGLTNGTTYDIALRAVNVVGAGPIAAGTGTPVTTPSAPTISSILSGNQQLTVSFLAPASDGGSVITDYQYSTNINAFSSIGATVAPFIISGLTNGTTYDIALRAVNAVGAGPIAAGTGTPSTSVVVNGWATNIGGGGNDIGNGITTDIFGNVYAIGTTGVSTTPSTSVNSYSIVSSGIIITSTFGLLNKVNSSDIFITKYNNYGVTQWATNIAGTSGDIGNAITSDTSGNIYTIGNCGLNTQINSYSTVSSGLIVTSTFGILSTTNVNADVCIAKYNSSGVVEWATNIGGTNADAGNGITTDTFNNIYVTGIYRGSTFINSYSTVSSNIILTNTFGKLLNPSATNTDAFIAKYNSSGIVQWATHIGSTIVSEVGNKVASDIFGNVYVVGTFNSQSTFVNSYSTVASDSTIVTSLFGRLSTFSTSSDAFIVKYNSSGITQWATTIGGTSIETGNDIAIDLDGNVYVAGSGASQIRINSYSTVSSSLILTSTFAILSTFDGTTDPFIVKYNSSGIAQWATNIGGVPNSNSGTNGIAIDTLNNIYFTGTFNGSTFINSYSTVSSGIIITSTFGILLSTPLANNTFSVKYNSSGIAQWATNINGSGTGNRGIKIATDINNNAFITGTFFNSAIINMFSTVSSGIIITSTFGRLSTISALSSDDAYIVKYDTNGQM
jgi:hypothetical protein